MSGGAGGITPAFAAFASHAVAQQAETASASSPVIATTAPEVRGVRGVRPVRLRAQRSEPAFLAAARQAAQAATVSAPVPPPASTDPPANSASAAADAASVPSSPDKVPSVASVAPSPSVVAAPSVSERRGAARLSPPRDLRASAGDEQESRLNSAALVRDAYQRSLEEQLAAHGVDYTVHVTQNGIYVYKLRLLCGARVCDLTSPLNSRVFRGVNLSTNFNGDMFDMYWTFSTLDGALLPDDTLLPSSGAELHATLRIHLPPHLGSDDGSSVGAASALEE